MREYECRAVLSCCERPTPILTSIKTNSGLTLGSPCARDPAWPDFQTSQKCPPLHTEYRSTPARKKYLNFLFDVGKRMKIGYRSIVPLCNVSA